MTPNVSFEVYEDTVLSDEQIAKETTKSNRVERDKNALKLVVAADAP
jgi:hypothetical protein